MLSRRRKMCILFSYLFDAPGLDEHQLEESFADKQHYSGGDDWIQTDTGKHNHFCRRFRSLFVRRRGLKGATLDDLSMISEAFLGIGRLRMR